MYKRVSDKEKKLFASKVKINWTVNNATLEQEGMGPQSKVNLQFDKTRKKPVKPGKGAVIGTKFHDFIIADQIDTKIDDNSYQSSITGIKFRIGHQRPHWDAFDYNPYNSYKERIIYILENYIKKLKSENQNL
jgi:hypothetical protein